MSARELRVPVDGGKMSVRVQGAGEPVLLVHGIFASGFSWNQVAPALSERYEVYTVDLLGFGNSDMPPDADYGQSVQAHRLHQVIGELGLRDVRLVGHSMGGEIAVHAALQAESPFKQLILVAADGFRPSFKRWQRTLLTGFWMDWFVRKTFDERGMHRSLRFMTYDPACFTAEMIEGYVRPYRRPEFPHAVRQMLQTRQAGLTPEMCRKIGLPTLLLWGEEDRIVPRRIGDMYHELLPHVAYRVCGQCGHIPMEENPQWFLHELLKFLGDE